MSLFLFWMPAGDKGNKLIGSDVLLSKCLVAALTPKDEQGRLELAGWSKTQTVAELSKGVWCVSRLYAPEVQTSSQLLPAAVGVRVSF